MVGVTARVRSVYPRRVRGRRRGTRREGPMSDKRREPEPRKDLDAVRETTGDDDPRAAAEDEFEKDPARNPDDDRLKGLKGG